MVGHTRAFTDMMAEIRSNAAGLPADEAGVLILRRCGLFEA